MSAIDDAFRSIVEMSPEELKKRNDQEAGVDRLRERGNRTFTWGGESVTARPVKRAPGRHAEEYYWMAGIGLESIEFRRTGHEEEGASWDADASTGGRIRADSCGGTIQEAADRLRWVLEQMRDDIAGFFPD